VSGARGGGDCERPATAQRQHIGALMSRRRIAHLPAHLVNSPQSPTKTAQLV
jgi:hypothetical protein